METDCLIGSMTHIALYICIWLDLLAVQKIQVSYEQIINSLYAELKLNLGLNPKVKNTNSGIKTV